MQSLGGGGAGWLWKKLIAALSFVTENTISCHLDVIRQLAVFTLEILERSLKVSDVIKFDTPSGKNELKIVLKLSQ